MTEHDDEALERLFERTAAEPSSFELTRMAARARELAPEADPASASARPPAPSPEKPPVNAAEDPSARAAAPASSEPPLEPGLSEDDLDALSLTPGTDDDLFDLSNAEEMELSR
jgi:hypothetical protein